MSLTIEDGTGVAGANSYVTADEFRAYADARGLAASFSSDDTTLEPYLIDAVDIIESYRARFQGVKTDSDNPLQFPRSGVFIDGTEIDDDVIPQELTNAQCQYALESLNGNSLMPNRLVADSGAVVEETVGPITVKYDKTAQRSKPVFSKAEAWLAPLFRRMGAVSIRT